MVENNREGREYLRFMTLCSITLQAFADALCAVSHGIPQPALCPRDSRPQPRSPCMGIDSCSSCSFLVSLLISFSIHIYVTM